MNNVKKEDTGAYDYQKLIENTPTYINAYLRKASLLMKMELYRNALGLYNEILKINPNYTQVYSEIGLCLDKLGKHSDAKRYYRKFLASRPDADNANLVMRRVEKLRNIKSKENKLSLV